MESGETHMVEEGAEINLPRSVMEKRKLNWRIAYLRTESSTDGCWPHPSGVEVVPLARLRQALRAPGLALSALAVSSATRPHHEAPPYGARP
jgi:hypothetical protein